ncbi:hypothetical protein EVAR_34489_1 [Eumeta japonica]|uniref:Uncharacterized protein n=1 Tax=Eumeta variegata TaxID=151549 RepID=A0A4C1WY70_EUMVA|nr:hypothetical protein EVAR_34489_1 [Eumeta japonica]
MLINDNNAARGPCAHRTRTRDAISAVDSITMRVHLGTQDSLIVERTRATPHMRSACVNRLAPLSASVAAASPLRNRHRSRPAAGGGKHERRNAKTLFHPLVYEFEGYSRPRPGRAGAAALALGSRRRSDAACELLQE